MKKIFIFITAASVSLFFMSCNRDYSCTIPVCDKKLFVEVFHHKFIDVAYDYLTDSSNFRMYIGKFDYEHGGYSYNCQGDSLAITETFEGEIVNIRKYSLIGLRKGKGGFYIP